jgi:hypothetical protein
VDLVEGEGGEVITVVPPDARLQLVHLVLYLRHLHKYLLYKLTDWSYNVYI